MNFGLQVLVIKLRGDDHPTRVHRAHHERTAEVDGKLSASFWSDRATSES